MTRNPFELFSRALNYWRLFGTRALLMRISQVVRQRTGRPLSLPSMQTAPTVAAVLQNRFHQLQPVSFFTVPAERPRLTIVTDSISKGSLFGGVGTALILGALGAQRMRGTLRVVTRTEPADSGALKHLLDANGIAYAGRSEFQFLPPGSSDQLQVHPLDRFVTTSWWTTEPMRRLDPRTAFYLLQEDERLFYPAGDDYVMSNRVLNRPELGLLVNSALLYEHFRTGGVRDFEARATAFEPAFSALLFHREPREPGARRTLFFYARPNNPRNLFYLGVEVINRALEQGVLAPEQWRIVLCGKDVPRLRFESAVQVDYAENLRWDEYAATIRGADLGLSLMLTPHPSYPPLDLAAAGAVVVTNRFGLKQDLSAYSRNILLADTDPEALVAALERGVALSADEKQRAANFAAHGLMTDWGAALGPTVERIAGTL